MGKNQIHAKTDHTSQFNALHHILYKDIDNNSSMSKQLIPVNR